MANWIYQKFLKPEEECFLPNKIIIRVTQLLSLLWTFSNYGKKLVFPWEKGDIRKRYQTNQEETKWESTRTMKIRSEIFSKIWIQTLLKVYIWHLKPIKGLWDTQGPLQHQRQTGQGPRSFKHFATSLSRTFLLPRYRQKSRIEKGAQKVHKYGLLQQSPPRPGMLHFPTKTKIPSCFLLIMLVRHLSSILIKYLKTVVKSVSYHLLGQNPKTTIRHWVCSPDQRSK